MGQLRHVSGDVADLDDQEDQEERQLRFRCFVILLVSWWIVTPAVCSAFLLPGSCGAGDLFPKTSMKTSMEASMGTGSSSETGAPPCHPSASSQIEASRAQSRTDSGLDSVIDAGTRQAPAPSQGAGSCCPAFEFAASSDASPATDSPSAAASMTSIDSAPPEDALRLHTSLAHAGGLLDEVLSPYRRTSPPLLN